MPDQLIRRTAIVAIALAALVGGGMAIRLASNWTVDAATLTERPPTAEELLVQLDEERSLAQGLRGRLTAMAGQVEDLTSALDAARAHASGEADTAAALAAKLDEAEATLAELQRTLAAAPPTLTVVTEAPAAQVASTGGSGGEVEDHDDEHEEEDD